MKFSLLLFGFLTVLTGCSATNLNAPSATTSLAPSSTISLPNSTPSKLVETSPTPTESLPSPAPMTAPTSPDKIISAEGIGVAKLGMKFGVLKQKLGKTATFAVKSLFRVDFDVIAITQSGKLQYSILYPTGTTFTDDSIIEVLVTDNPEYKTREGVGPDTLLKQAIALYGEATLYYNTSNESREYVKFAKYPSPNLYFRPMGLGRGLVGIYPASPQEFQQTQVFQDRAVIHSVEVLCRPPVCPLK